jgi:hypothetical protein
MCSSEDSSGCPVVYVTIEEVPKRAPFWGQETVKGDTLLHMHCRRKSEFYGVRVLQVMRPELLDRLNSDGHSALWLALRLGLSDVATALLDKGVGVAEGILTKRDEQGWTALHYASYYHWDTRVAERLLDRGADPNARTFGLLETPLHLASYAGLTGQIRLLKERGADGAARTKRGETAADLLDGMYQ